MKTFNRHSGAKKIGGGSGVNTLALVIFSIIIFTYIMYTASIGQYNITNSVSRNADGKIIKIHSAHENQEAAYSVLKKVNTNLREIVSIFPDENIRAAYTKIIIVENSPHNKNNETSYVKDGLMVLCIRDEYGELHDFNTVMFVALHELSHFAATSDDDDHGPEYWAIFGKMLRAAEMRGLIQNIDYSKAPTKYCGVDINFNPVFTSKLN